MADADLDFLARLEDEKERLRAHFGRELAALEADLSSAERRLRDAEDVAKARRAAAQLPGDDDAATLHDVQAVGLGDGMVRDAAERHHEQVGTPQAALVDIERRRTCRGSVNITFARQVRRARRIVIT